jgi:hypothetical protein
MTAEEQAHALVTEAKSERPLSLPWVDAYVGRFGPISEAARRAGFADRTPGTIGLARSPAVRNAAKADIANPDSVAIFDALHRGGTVSEAMLYAFDLLDLDGEDLRDMPLSDRKKRLARLVGRRQIGIVLSEQNQEDAHCFRPRVPHGPRGHRVDASR